MPLAHRPFMPQTPHPWDTKSPRPYLLCRSRVIITLLLPSDLVSSPLPLFLLTPSQPPHDDDALTVTSNLRPSTTRPLHIQVPRWSQRTLHILFQWWFQRTLRIHVQQWFQRTLRIPFWWWSRRTLCIQPSPPVRSSPIAAGPPDSRSPGSWFPVVGPPDSRSSGAWFPVAGPPDSRSADSWFPVSGPPDLWRGMGAKIKTTAQQQEAI
ncbi:uncharacterized protein [Nothobranchius furzeri]|uniref:uncharacterized protein n=1 Tax=Nothobranchius furzeri TaxID=105023 RepID=UPI003904C408